MDTLLLEFYRKMRGMRKKAQELQEQYSSCGIVVLDVKTDTFLFMDNDLRKQFESPMTSVLKSKNSKRIREFIQNVHQFQESETYANSFDFTNIRVEDKQGSYWVQLYACKCRLKRRRDLACIMWVKLEEPQEKIPKKNNQINNQINNFRRTDKYLTDNYLFEWNICDDKILLPENWKIKFKAHNLPRKINGQMIECYILKEDIPKFHKFQNDIRGGISPDDILLRFYIGDDEGEYAWCSITFLNIFYDGDIPMYAIGRVQDIDKKLRSLRQEERSLYTSGRAEARRKIDEILENKKTDQMHALLTICLNIKEITQNEEIFWGASAISYSLVKNLSCMIYPTDVLLVHDNYMVVFLENVGNEENVVKKACRIHKLFERMTQETLSVEMGIALWPRDGKNFEELLMHSENPSNIKVKWFADNLAEGGSACCQPTQETEQGQWSISAMSDIMDDWYNMLYMNSRLKHQMELAKSQIMLGQIKPHFIFNALANIKALIYTDPGLAENLTIAFTKYLRAYLNALGREEMISFREDLDFIDNYIKIEQSRFPGKIHVTYDIFYDQFQIPHFILQPLVENAIKHGLCKKEGTGTLRILSYLDEGDICIVIEDDGIGFSQTLKRTVDSGIGVKNVRKRLAYLLDGSLLLNSEVGRGTRAVIRFKKNDKERR